MNICIDAVSKIGMLILFTDSREIVAREEFNVLGNESQKLCDIILWFLEKNNTSLKDINEIVVVSGPWSFTWIRTITLIVNTFAFLYEHLKLTDISYFELFPRFPIIKQSSKRDVFYYDSEASEVLVLTNEQAKWKINSLQVKKIYWDIEWDFWNVFIEKQPNYATICQKISFKGKKRIDPLYIKKPNIS